ncbi:MAG: translation elongation factor Ts [Planctomycetota bacterium]|nr:translation elongation factor Ts [Planctomycetota bacterium]MDA1105594.1 translation elongation factor Ts [Planctomycetota bacterium]
MSDTTVKIDPKAVMILRQKTGLGMGACKDALVEANGNAAEAEKILRERMKDKMDARSERAAGEGCVVVAVNGGKMTVLDVRSETDFTARNDEFRAMAADLATMALAQAAGAVSMTPEMTTRLDDVRLKTGENVQFGKGVRSDAPAFAKYVHHDHRLAAVIAYEGELPDDVGVGICQHIAAHVPTPVAVDADGVCKDEVARVRAAAQAEAGASGKPAQIAEKIAEGKMRKYFEEVTLLGQAYVRDDKVRVSSLLPKGTKILGFWRYVVG